MVQYHLGACDPLARLHKTFAGIRECHIERRRIAESPLASELYRHTTKMSVIEKTL